MQQADNNSDFLFQYFDNNPGRLTSKWLHYFAIYERHLRAYRSRPIRLLEYGVYHGGSLQMWKQYLHPESLIVGVDIDPRCRALAEPGIAIEIGDQEDPKTHACLRERYGDFDIVIDDGGHSMQQQIVTFQEMYPAVKTGGLYIAEDLHTSYMQKWGGSLRHVGTFIEFSKTLIDQLHAWYSESEDFKVDLITESAYALHFYDSMLIIEKQAIKHPTVLMTGEPTFAMNALEYVWLAGHYRRKAQFARAISFCQHALELRPGLPEATSLLADILAEQAKTTT